MTETASEMRRLTAIRDAIAPAVSALGCSLYDVELAGGGRARTLRVTIQKRDDARTGASQSRGVDLETITAATQAISPVLDRTDVVPGPYQLEVSSPGVERVLRTPEHFAGALGETVTVKYHSDDGPQRVRGRLVAADDTQCTVESGTVESDCAREEITYDRVTQARTVFEWGPQPRPGRPSRGAGRTRAKERS